MKGNPPNDTLPYSGLKCVELCNCEDCPNVQSVTFGMDD